MVVGRVVVVDLVAGVAGAAVVVGLVVLVLLCVTLLFAGCALMLSVEHIPNITMMILFIC